MSKDTVADISAQILAVRNNEATRNLVLDIWNQPAESAVAFAQMILDGVRNYVSYERKWKITPKT